MGVGQGGWMRRGDGWGCGMEGGWVGVDACREVTSLSGSSASQVFPESVSEGFSLCRSSTGVRPRGWHRPPHRKYGQNSKENKGFLTYGHMGPIYGHMWPACGHM